MKDRLSDISITPEIKAYVLSELAKEEAALNEAKETLDAAEATYKEARARVVAMLDKLRNDILGRFPTK